MMKPLCFVLASTLGASGAVDTARSASERTQPAWSFGTIATAQEVKKTIWDGVYTEEQARRGEQTYKRWCGYCHRDNLRGGFFDDGVGMAPALAGSGAFGSSFSDRWSELTVGDMVDAIGTTMPQNAPASLTVQSYVDIILYPTLLILHCAFRARLSAP